MPYPTQSCIHIMFQPAQLCIPVQNVSTSCFSQHNYVSQYKMYPHHTLASPIMYPSTKCTKCIYIMLQPAQLCIPVQNVSTSCFSQHNYVSQYKMYLHHASASTIMYPSTKCIHIMLQPAQLCIPVQNVSTSCFSQHNYVSQYKMYPHHPLASTIMYCSTTCIHIML